MLTSHEDLIEILNDNQNVEVLFDKEIVDECDTTPEKIEDQTGRKHRLVREWTYNKTTETSHYIDKVLFEIGSAA